MKAGTTALLGVGGVATLLLLAHSQASASVGSDVRLFDVVAIPIRSFPALALPALFTTDLKDPQGTSILLQVTSVAPDGSLAGTLVGAANRAGEADLFDTTQAQAGAINIANVSRSSVSGILKRGRQLTSEGNRLESGSFA